MRRSDPMRIDYHIVNLAVNQFGPAGVKKHFITSKACETDAIKTDLSPERDILKLELGLHLLRPKEYYHLYGLDEVQYQNRPWMTIECSRSAARTTNRSFIVASRAKAFPGRPINSGSILPRAANPEGGVIGCHKCLQLAHGSAPASLDMRPTPLRFVLHAY